MKVLVVYDIPGWAYWRRANAIQKFAPADVEVDIADCMNAKWQRCNRYDVIFLIEYTHALIARKMLTKHGSKTPLVISHNSDSRRRHELWKKVTTNADYVICNNKEVFDFHKRPKNTCCISNGFDPDLFRSTVPIADRPHKAIWCGSSGHKKGKGYHEILLPLAGLLKRERFECEFRPIDGNGWNENKEPNRKIVYGDSKLLDWYNSASYVVCASKTEGTPNYLLEAAACGCVPVSTRVGNILEFGRDRNNCVFAERDIKSFVEAMKVAKETRKRLHESILADMDSWQYQHRAPYFFALFKAIAQGRYPDPFCYSEIKPNAI